jgi:hypothetical protein
VESTRRGRYSSIGIEEMRGIVWTVALIGVVLLSVSLISYSWVHWLAR